MSIQPSKHANTDQAWIVILLDCSMQYADIDLMRKLILVIIVLSAAYTSLWGFGAWRVLESEYFLVYHKPEMELEAHKVIDVMEHYRIYVETLTGGSNPQVSIMLEDTGMEANGFADAGNNKISLFSHFPTDGSLAILEDWWTLVGVHEYIHMLQIGTDSGGPRVMRLIFGDSIMVNALLPMWMIEGITVYGESGISAFSGRLNGGDYPGIVASLAHHHEIPSPSKASYYSDDIPMSNYYVLGGAFYSWLAEQYGREKFAEFYRINGGNMSSFLSPLFPGAGIDIVAKRVFGKSFPELWEDWKQDTYLEHENLAMPAEIHSGSGWQKDMLRLYGDKLYYTQRSRIKTGAGSSFSSMGIMCYDPLTNQSKLIHRQATNYPAGYQIRDNSLYYSRYRSRGGYDNTANQGRGYVVEILREDLSGGRSELLATGDIRAFCVLEDGSLIYAQDNPRGTGAQLISIQDHQSKLIWESDEYLVHDIRQHEGAIYLNARAPYRNSSIYLFDGTGLIPLVDSPYQELISGFWGDDLIYTSNAEGQYHSYFYHPESQEIQRVVAAEYTRDAVVYGDRLYYLAMLPGGLDLASDPLQLENYEQSETLSYNLSIYQPNETLPSDAEYRKGSAFWPNIRHMLVPRRYRMPVAYPSSFGIGLAGTDLLGYIPWWDTEVVYDWDKERLDILFNLTSNILQPLQQDISISTYDGGSLGVRNYIPLYQNNNFGLNQINLGLGFLTQDSYKRKIWNPYTYWAWSSASQRIMTELYAKAESRDFIPSDRNRLGFGAYHNLRQLLPLETELRGTVHWAYDPDADTDEVFVRIFGYSDGIRANKGFLTSASLSHVLFEVREGLWNPQLYLEDVGMSVFYEYAKPLDSPGVDTQYSYGVELTGEFSTFFRLNLNLGLRVGLNKNGDLCNRIMLSAGY